MAVRYSCGSAAIFNTDPHGKTKNYFWRYIQMKKSFKKTGAVILTMAMVLSMGAMTSLTARNIQSW